MEEYAFLPESALVAVSENPEDGTTLDSMIDIWDGRNIQTLTKIIEDEIALRKKTKCTMRVHKRKAPVHDIRMGKGDISESTDEDESGGEDESQEAHSSVSCEPVQSGGVTESGMSGKVLLVDVEDEATDSEAKGELVCVVVLLPTVCIRLIQVNSRVPCSQLLRLK